MKQKVLIVIDGINYDLLLRVLFWYSIYEKIVLKFIYETTLVLEKYLWIVLCTFLWCTFFSAIEGSFMDERVFRIWIEQTKGYNTARTYVARCIQVENELCILA